MTTEITARERVELDQERHKVYRLIHHLGVSLSILSGQTVVTKIVPTLPAPAATEYNNYKRYYRGGTDHLGRYEVSYSTHILPQDNLVVWLGTTWHELGHILWSRWKPGINLTHGYNLLEDARIEGLLLGTYPNTRSPLLATLKWMMETGSSATSSNYPLANSRHMLYQYAWMCGRRHLPKELREKHRKLISPRYAKQIEVIFKEYLSMGDKFVVDKAMRLSKQLDAILGTERHLDTKADNRKCSVLSISKGRDKSDPATPGTMADYSDLDTTDDDDDTADTDDTGTGGDRDFRARGEKVAAEIIESIESILEGDEELAKEVDALRKIVSGGFTAPNYKSDVKPVTPSAANTAREIRRVATRFNDTSGKGLVRHRDYGRLKPIRYERTGELDTAYDMWEPGLDQEMYISLYIDCSGSMLGSPISDIVYGLEMGLNEVATVETVYFNKDYWVATESSNQYRMPNIKASGGTYPVAGMAYIYPQILRAPQANKLFVLYTDGGFDSVNSNRTMGAYFDQLVEHGVNIKLLANPSGTQPLRNLVDQLTRRVKLRDVYDVPGLRNLPNVVLKWTTDVLSSPMGGV